MLHEIESFFKANKKYYEAYRSNIAERNNKMLKRGCITYALVLTFYTFLIFFTEHTHIVMVMYCLFDALHICLCLLVYLCGRDEKKYRLTNQILCCCLEVSILSFFALEGVFFSRTQHSLYIPIAALLVILLFIHRFLYSELLCTLYLVGFSWLSFLYKTPQASTNDILMAIATFIAANIGYVLVTQMRHSEATALLNYAKLSQTDQLTGAYNKASIQNICERILQEPKKFCHFIILDLDNFKGINDCHGHQFGDEVLKKVCQKMQANFRETDYIGRFGGDEFIILMENCADTDIVKERVERVLANIMELSFSVKNVQVQCSAGVSLKREGDTITSIFQRADDALYQAKRNGKGKYVIIE